VTEEQDEAAWVLLVEDEEDDAELIARAFRRAGIANPLERAVDGDAAVARLGDPVRLPPALVLLDLKLPRRSGFEVLEWLRAGGGGEAVRRVPVVVLTSSDQERDVRRAYDLGANSYLVKPVGAPALLEMARNLDGYWLRLNRAANPVGA
jgi:CheY-like chemotaxis protein